MLSRNIGILNQRIFPVSGLVSYWRFDESSGNAADSKGSYTLTNSNATYAAGKNNNAAIYTTGDYFENTSTNMGYGAAGTFTMWIWFDNYTAAYQIIDGSGGNTGINFQLYSHWLYFKVYGDSSFMNNASGGIQPVSGAWMHIGVSWNGTNRKIYSNNSVVSATKNATSAPNGKLVVGITAAHAYSLQGKLDEMGYWNRQLSDAEVTALYNLGTGIYY